MSALNRVYEYARGSLKDSYAMALVSTGMLLANVLDREAMVVRANDSLGKQAALSLPSALPAAEIVGNPTADLGIQIAYSAGSLGLACRTTSRVGVAVTAVVAQEVACAANAIVERSDWLNPAEKAQDDVGFSAIALAWGTKALLDRRAEASDQAKRKYALGGIALGGLFTVGALLYDKEGGKLDLTSHVAGIAVGWAAHLFGDFRKKAEQGRIKADFAALATKYPTA